MKLTSNLPATTPDKHFLKQQEKKVERVIILLDISGSMEDHFPPFSSRLDAAKEALYQFVTASSRAASAIGLVAFDSTAVLLSEPTGDFSKLIGKARQLSPRGGTRYSEPLRGALQHLADRVVLISDGEPADGREAVDIARAEYRPVGVKIDCIAIADRGTILEQLAELTGGTYTIATDAAKLVKQLVQLETRNRLQLEHKA